MIPTKPSWKKIHIALHSDAKQVIIDKKAHPVQVHRNGCRMVGYSDTDLGKVVFMQQNKNKSSVYAERARNGETLTWVIPADPHQRWILLDMPVPKSKEVVHG